jgi:hypothetical protein
VYSSQSTCVIAAAGLFVDVCLFEQQGLEIADARSSVLGLCALCLVRVLRKVMLHASVRAARQVAGRLDQIHPDSYWNLDIQLPPTALMLRNN